jgi:hypothetical protein
MMTKQRLSQASCAFGAGMILVSAATYLAAGQVREIPGNWAATGMRRVAATGVIASSALSSDDGPYAPSRAVDGNRGTKWVASIAPSEADPQWITLELLGTQEVSPVAIFGERIDNDGIKDAQIQVADVKADQFISVAMVQNARSSAWLATFSEPSRSLLVAEIERLEVRLQPLIRRLERATTIWPGRARELALARQKARDATPGEKTICIRDDGKVRLGNNRVTVVLTEADGVWDATWLRCVDAAVRRVGFAVEAGGQLLVPQAARTETGPVTDAVGSGREIRQRWGKGIEIQRSIRVYDGKPAVLLSAQISNNTGRDVPLATVRMLDASKVNHGWWHLANMMQAPAAVGYFGASPPCRPSPDVGSRAEAELQYDSAGVLALVQRGSPGGLVIGSLSAVEGGRSIYARFQAGEGGTCLGANLSFGGRILRTGQTVVLDPVWLSVEHNGHDALERYGDAVAALETKPVRTGANALWCSWYPIRMGINEEVVLTHAAIAAKHFKSLGLNVIQLDHGWQRGDVCGDWEPNERFPHGLKWLSEQLRSRYGMNLGLWIAPTQVAFTSQLFRAHPEWMIQGVQGRPASTGRWFWVPNPEMTLLDASHPAAAKWIEETFARLSAEGSVYYKIDFIAGSPALRRAMEAIRRGAGPDAWIRYCQTPPLLSVGLANSSYIGDDTGDAGLAGWMQLERINAPLLAASYWINDRLYHREVCDMSVGMKASIEEARFKLSLMTLSGCSISFSDDFRALEPSRIRMMQQCLPPGNPMARPLDLFERELPSLWHMQCKNEAGQWDAVGVFNFEDQPQERTVELSSLGLTSAAEVAVFEFWEEKFLGMCKERVTLSLAPRTSRILLIHRRPSHPQIIATNMHVLGGFHEIKRLVWDEKQGILSGTYQRAPGLKGHAYIYVPDTYRPLPDSALNKGQAGLIRSGTNVWVQEIQFKDPQVAWAIKFASTKP